MKPLKNVQFCPSSSCKSRHRGKAKILSMRITMPLGVALINTVIWVVLYQFQWVTPEENGGMENVQAAEMLLSTFFFLVIVRSRGERLERVFFSSLALLCVTFFLREVDIEKLGFNPVITWLGSGFGRNLWLGVAWLVFLLIFSFHARKLCKIFLTWLNSLAGRTMLLAGLFFILAWPLDKNVFPISRLSAQFYEELLELNASILMLLSSCFSFLTRKE